MNNKPAVEFIYANYLLQHKRGEVNILKKKQLLLGIVLSLFVVATVGVPAAHAQSNKPTVTQNQDNDGNNNNDRPGWGFGDKHHHHVGPPGHSVRPGDGDNDGDDQGHNISSAQFQQFLAELHALVIKFFG